MIKTSSKKKALSLLAELDENERQVNQEVVCYKKSDSPIAKRLVCHTAEQIETFYLPKGKKKCDKTKHDRERYHANGAKKKCLTQEQERGKPKKRGKK